MDYTIESYNALVERLLALSVAYYDNDAPLVSDFEYDRMNNELKRMEAEHPEWIRPDSPTQHVGGHVSEAFAPVAHEVPLESLADVFSFEEVEAFVRRMDEAVAAPHDFVTEPKIDGLSVAVEYRNGMFFRGATRGNGEVGEDVRLAKRAGLLHDIGKVREISSGMGFPYTTEGRLLGHITMSVLMVRETALELKLPATALQQLEHIILSHHGDQEKGSPMACATKEAFIVHYADEVNSIMNQFDVKDTKIPWEFNNMMKRYLMIK